MSQCECCGIKEQGEIYDEELIEFRGHMICSWCKGHWLEMERKLGRTLRIKDFQRAFGGVDLLEKS
ncbi:hypothetical protein LCGC14_1694060 [marine sediment metagenome]|uniref:Uncharacterized protein n=1 Tax=marine sediment metagenome TaxID=412755 RepID=A0A0F9I7H3_9ZZZZ